MPRDRSGEFSTALFERFQRSEKALVSALVEMYVQGVLTRTGLFAGPCESAIAATMPRPD